MIVKSIRLPRFIVLMEILILLLLVISCDSFLDVDFPESRISSEQIFKNERTVTAAITGIYIDMLTYNSFSSGTNQGVVSLTGLSSDELINYSGLTEYIDFEMNSLLPDNAYVFDIWRSAYQCIYRSNSIIQGLSFESNTLSDSFKSQIIGEAKFVRAFCYFYLVNVFGGVPLITDTDYENNSMMSRSSESDVYKLIVSDLLSARELMLDEYVSVERSRPNRASATALLARVQLYMGNWKLAEERSSEVIDDSRYRLVDSLSDVFLANSIESIWQIRPSIPGRNSEDAVYFIINSTSINYSLSNAIIDSFEDYDRRASNWIGSYDTGEDTVYFPYKFRVIESESPVEYPTVLRLAEQYLIRAEARARQMDLVGAISDINVIRYRAGASLIEPSDDIELDSVLLMIEEERVRELFCEWGHRWFDLKRTERIDAVLGSIKPNWDFNMRLYPIPQSEFKRNINLGRQNDGY